MSALETECCAHPALRPILRYHHPEPTATTNPNAIVEAQNFGRLIFFPMQMLLAVETFPGNVEN
jgi:hypothetical protein